MKALEVGHHSTRSASFPTDTVARNIVLVGFAEALSAPEVVWSLVDDGFQVVAFSRRGRTSALRHSRHVVCHEICPPESDLQAALADLRALMTSLGEDSDRPKRILFPLDDKAVWLCSEFQLQVPWLLAGPQDGAAELALDKHLQFQAAREAGFDVPEALLTSSADEIVEFSVEKSFPIILKSAKPVPTHNGRVVECPKWICANHGELARATKEWAGRTPLLVQKFVTGTGEGVFGLAAPDGIRAWSAHRRLRMMNPQGSGSSACVSQPVSDDIKFKIGRLIENAGWRGLFMIELLRDPSGRLWFVELNGRPWGSMALARRQKLEYPAWQVRLAIDEQSSAGAASCSSPGMVCRHAGREFMHILFVLKGSKSKALKNWPPFWKTMADILPIHRGDTFYNWRRDDTKVFLADFYYTVHNNVFKQRH
jgi:predicted ATP-grasp superfamily ATP-dependent carboligase